MRPTCLLPAGYPSLIPPACCLQVQAVINVEKMPTKVIAMEDGSLLVATNGVGGSCCASARERLEGCTLWWIAFLQVWFLGGVCQIAASHGPPPRDPTGMHARRTGLAPAKGAAASLTLLQLDGMGRGACPLLGAHLCPPPVAVARPAFLQNCIGPS